MEKKAWIIFAVVCVVIIVAVLILMLILVPQQKSSGVQAEAYKPVAKQEYTYDGTNADRLKQQYTVTSKDVEKGLQTNKYEEGNINPFTPNKEVTIYNEPTKKNENGSSPLTPDSK